ncbi:MAG: hypothetical protein IPK00_26185 [Deltaproteobacteria bacterium]|nr:hypothetical protein [Deltaproteobacteria bacterium]
MSKPWPYGRRLVRASAASLFATLVAASSTAQASVSISLFDPFNHGHLGANEVGAERIDRAQRMLSPDLGDLSGTDFVHFSPWYAGTPGGLYDDRNFELESYPSVVRPYKNPHASRYRNLHLVPTDLDFPGQVVIGPSRYFNRLELQSTTLGSPGFTPNGGTFQPVAGHLDTGIGSATGSVSASGRITLRVDVDASDGVTPVAEGAIQATLHDVLTLSGSQPTAQIDLSLLAHAIAPQLDMLAGEFYSYAVGYEIALFAPTTVPDLQGVPSPGIIEYWADRGFYWMDAHRRINLQTGDRWVDVDSLGRTPAGREGIDYDVLFFPGGGSTFFREIPYTLASPVVSDTSMPYLSMIRSGAVTVPTGVPLQFVVQFFVMAGCSDPASGCSMTMDATQSVQAGLQVLTPGVTVQSQSGFTLPTSALPEPGGAPMLIAGVLALASAAARRGRRGY